MAVTQLKRKYATPLYEAQQRTFAAKQRIKQLHLEESFGIAKLFHILQLTGTLMHSPLSHII